MTLLTSACYERYLSTHLQSSYGAFSGMRRLRQAYHVANILPRLCPAREAPLLEIGPGFGELLETVLERGFRHVHAVDISPEVVAHVGAAYPAVECRQIIDLSDYLRSKPGLFQNIVMVDVIEHLPKDEVVAVLRAAHEALAPGGRLVVQTVNMGSPMAGNVFFSDFTHTWGYTELSSREVFAVAGFRHVEVFGYRFPRGPVGIVRTILRAAVQLLVRFCTLANGMLRLRNMDPALVIVATAGAGETVSNLTSQGSTP